MTRLLKFELYKIFTRKSIYLAVLLFLIIYGVFVSSTMSKPDVNTKEYQQWAGLVTGEKVNLANEGIDAINKKYGITNDASQPYIKAISPDDIQKLSIYSTVLDAEYRANTREMNLNVIQNDIKNMEQKGIKGYAYNVRTLEYNMINSTQGPGIYYNTGVSQVVDFTGAFGMIFMAAMVLLGLSPVFSEEYSINMDSLILSSKNGRNKTIGAKILSSIVYITSTALFFSAVNVLTNMYFYGDQGWDAPIQSMFKYLMSPYSLNIGQYYLIELLFHVFGLISFGLLILAISSASKSSLMTLFTGGVIYIIPLAAGFLLAGGPGWVKEIIKFSYSEFVKAESIFKWFKAYDLFGIPVLYPITAAFVIVVLSFLCIHYTYKIFKSHEVTG